VKPLLEIIMATLAPLMTQNEAAWRAATGRGESLFNEAAFDRGRAVYDGEPLGHPFRSAVKTFQMRVWQEIREAWQPLAEDERVTIEDCLPGTTPLNANERASIGGCTGCRVTAHDACFT